MPANLELPPELIDGSPAVAHLTPATTNNPGTLTAFPSEQSCTYRSSNGPIETPGLYRIEYDVSFYMKKGMEQASLMVEEAIEAAPTSEPLLRGMLSAVTEFGEDIYQEISSRANSVEEMYDLATDEEVLRSVDGIGEDYSRSISEKIETFGRTELRLYSILKQYGIPYNRDNKREQWTKAYFQENPEKLSTLEKNPYLLLSVADPWRQSVKEISEKTGAVPVSYRLEDIDGGIVESEPRFENHVKRLIAHLSDIISSVYGEGHTVASLDQALSAVQEQGFSRFRKSMTENPIRLTRDRLLIIAREAPGLEVTSYRAPNGSSKTGITTPRLRGWTSTIQRAIRRFKTETSPFSPRLRRKMTRAAKESVPFDLTQEQTSALRGGFCSAISAVSGPAGSGKTTVTTCFLRAALLSREEQRTFNPIEKEWETATGFSIYVTASTGTAVQRIRRGLDLTHPQTGEPVDPVAIGEVDAEATRHQRRGDLAIGTLHSFLRYKGPGRGFDVRAPHPSVIFVDEASMADEPAIAALMEYALTCISYGAPVCILLAGDANQLPPVGKGFPFRDLLGGRLAAQIPTTRLSKVMRQKKGSMIIEAANRVLNEKEPPTLSEYQDRGLDPNEQDFGWAFSPPTSAGNAIDRYMRILRNVGYDPNPQSIQLVLPLRNPSSVEPEALHMRKVNQTLQQRFAQKRREEIQEMDVTYPDRPSEKATLSFSVGDRIMHVGRNEYKPGTHEPIMRGAKGKILSIDEGQIRVRYPWIKTPVLYDGPEEIWQLSLAYALTCHAAQGSEFDFQILSIPRRGGPGMIDRNWLYTAITRAKKDLRMLAPRGRVRNAIQRSQNAQRQTLLTSTE